MLEVGRYNTLQVLREVRIGYHLGRDGEELVLLPRRHAPEEGLAVGDSVRVFVLTDSEDRLTATTQVPYAQLGEFACLRVVDVNDVGAFLDWGLEKDLFLPYGEMHSPVHVGQYVVVGLRLGARGRIVAGARLAGFFDRDVSDIEVGQPVDLIVYAFNDFGALVIVDRRYSGMIYRDDVQQRIDVGTRLKGWVKDIRPEQRLDITLRRPGRAGQLDAAGTILAALDEDGGRLALHDKSPPEDIARRLKMSKKVFKAAVGKLYRDRKVQLVDGGIERAQD